MDAPPPPPPPPGKKPGADDGAAAAAAAGAAAEGLSGKAAKKAARAARVASRADGDAPAGPAEAAAASRPPGAAAGEPRGASGPGAGAGARGAGAAQQQQQRGRGASASSPTTPPPAVPAGPPTVAGFSHIPHHVGDRPNILTAGPAAQVLHPSFLALAATAASTAAAPSAAAGPAALLGAIAAFVRAFQPGESGSALARELDKALVRQLDALQGLVPLGPAAAHAIRTVRSLIMRLPPSVTDADAKAAVLAAIDAYLADRVNVHEALAAAAAAALGGTDDGDVGGGGPVVVFGGGGAAVEAVARRLPARVPVIVLDARPHVGARDMAARLIAGGRPVAYGTLAGAAQALTGSAWGRARAVVLASDAVFADGAVLGPVGQGPLAALARRAGVPVFAAAETFRFVTDRAVSDSLAVNEMAAAATLRLPGQEGPQQAAAAPVAAAAPKAGAKAKPDAPPPVAWEDSGSLAGRVGKKVKAPTAAAVAAAAAAGAAGAAAGAGAPSAPTPRLLPLNLDTVPGAWIAGYITEAGFVPAASLGALARELERENERDGEEEGEGEGEGEGESDEDEGDEDEDGEEDGA
jgi:translation initiation factor 2B subunit (eIF-2B alpha/beta/delta family)